MGFYRDVVYPSLVRRLGNPKPIQALREQVVPLARGDVLEIGVALRDRYGTTLWVLLALAGILLAVACANLAGLTLARSLTRGHPVAMTAVRWLRIRAVLVSCDL